MLRNKPHLVLWLAVFALFELSALSCGPDFPTAIFVLGNGPGDYATYAAGHLGVVQSSYFHRTRAIAWNWLNGRALTPEEQKEALAADSYMRQNSDAPYTANPASANSQPVSPTPNPVKDWVDARDTVIQPVYATNAEKARATANTSSSTTQRAVPNDAYQSFNNCLDDSYANAARTLKTRIKSYGATNPEVIEWVRGQDAVFSNCDGTGTLPTPLTTGSLWLRQDRAYQIAAARFYAVNYDGALQAFSAIAADTASPWSTLSRYLEARTLLRKASVSNDTSGYGNNSPGTQGPRSAYLQGLTAAQKELLAMRAEPRMTKMLNQINDLLDLINTRLQPEQQKLVIAARIESQHPHHLKQALIDLAWLYDHPATDNTNLSPAQIQLQIKASQDARAKALASAAQHDAADLIDWLQGGPKVDPVASWRSEHKLPWLLDALEFSKPGDPVLPELLAAAAQVPQSSPGWTAVTYHRLRLMPRNAAMHEQLLAVLPVVVAQKDASTTNLFLGLSASTAPTLADWIAAAPREPAGETSWGETDSFSPPMVRDGATSTPENACGTKLKQGVPYLLFDDDAAYGLNAQMPLELLAKAAADASLPENLRFQVAQAAWARAVMLDRPEIAAQMSPLLIACRAAWKPVLDAYNQSKTNDDRHANGLLALMRFASTEPSVRDGEERRNGFATYDEYRQNWWCSTVPHPGETVDNDPNPPANSGYVPPAPPPTPPTPLFLTAADKASATSELAMLQKIPSGSDYFATQALAWFKAHPKDPRTADIVGEANQVLHNSCRNDGTPKLAHALFDVLHQSFPQSSWAKKYKTWE